MEQANLNIYQRMLLVTERINKVAKNLKVGVGNNQYRAVGEADVLEAVKPAEIEAGIYSYPASRKVIDTNVLTTKNEYNGKVTEKNNLFMRIETVYRFVNAHDPKEFIDITTYGDGVDSQDKAPGKAMTYSDKYALLKAYKIETGDDPDQKKSEEGRFNENKHEEPPAPQQSKEEEISNRKINAVQSKALHAEMNRTGSKIDPVKAGFASLEEINFGQWKKYMDYMGSMASKKKEDLGL